MNRIAKSLAIGSILLASVGFATPANAAPAKSWDCDTNGTTQCTNPVLEDAWQSFDSLKKAPKYTHSNPLRYVKTYHKYPMVSSHSVVVKSVTKSTTWYVFSYAK